MLLYAFVFVQLGPDHTALIFLFRFVFRFLELFTNAIVLPLIVFQTKKKKHEKTERKSEKSVSCSQEVILHSAQAAAVCIGV